jgi:hypothetical protein
MACLEKNIANRPQTARDLALMIAKAPTAHSWEIDSADGWWGRYERGQDPNGNAGSPNGSPITNKETANSPGRQITVGPVTTPNSSGGEYDRTYLYKGSEDN